MESLLFPSLYTPSNRPALTLGEETLSYADLAKRLRAYLSGLQEAGLQYGDRVGVWTRPGLDTIVALLGNAVGGMVSVPLNPKLGPKELKHILGDSAPRLVIEDRLPESQADPGRSLPARSVNDEPMLILYTSGTTGNPKGAMISARNVATNLDGLAEAWEWTPDDTIVHSLPLFHVHGLVLGLFGSIRRGGHFRWVPRFEPHALATALEETSGVLFAVPTMYHRLADAAEVDESVARGLRQARRLVSGSAGLPLRDHQRIHDLIGQGVYERYGLTETLILCAVPASGPPRPGYVGPPVPGIELRLVDDERRALGANDDHTIGEVSVRGPNVFLGYLGREDATAAVLDDEGWFYTGDLATRTSDGDIRIVGRRATDLIKTGGYKVGAGEIEACLLEIEGVAEVAVLGEPDPDLGERIVAFVVPRDDAELDPGSMTQYVADQLTPHKRPRAVHFRDALPRNAMGKVQKKRLREP